MEFKKLYKGNLTAKNRLESIKETVLANRRSKRLQNFNRNRKSLNKDEESDEGNNVNEKINRQALLVQWKQKKLKEKQMIDGKKKKPFVVGIIHHNICSPLFKDISNVGKASQHNKRDMRSNKVIAPLNVLENTDITGVKSFPFVTTASQFKFKLQPSLKQLTVPQSPNFFSAKKKKVNQAKSKELKLETDKNLVNQKENIGSSVRNLRNKRCRIRLETETPTKPKLPKKVESTKTTVPDTVHDKRIPVSTSGGELHSAASVVANILEGDGQKVCSQIEIPFQDDSSEVTPRKSYESEKEEFVISPFVTITRGKQRHSAPRPVDSAKKQDPRRMSNSCLSVSVTQEHEVASEAGPYYERLDKETKHIIDLCNNWSKMVSNSNNIPKEISDEIDVAVGQSRLLVSDKFQQFRSLIDRFESNAEPPVIKSDLDGFWDMMYIQVELVNERFSKLTTLKDNNWMPVSKVSPVKLPKLKRLVKKGSEDRPMPQLKVQGNFRQFLKEMKGKKSAAPCSNDIPSSNEEELLCNNLSSNTSASPRLSSRNGTPRKSALSESLLKKVLSNSVNEKVRTSLSSAHNALRTSLIGKELGTSPVILVDSINQDSSFNRSILIKSPKNNDSRVKKKVLFGDAICISPTGDDIDELLNTTFTLQNNSEDDCEQNQLELNSGFDLDTSIEKKEEVNFDTSLVSPKQSRKRRLGDNFTPRRSARLMLKEGMSTPSTDYEPPLCASRRSYKSGTPHPKK